MKCGGGYVFFNKCWLCRSLLVKPGLWLKQARTILQSWSAALGQSLLNRGEEALENTVLAEGFPCHPAFSCFLCKVHENHTGHLSEMGLSFLHHLSGLSPSQSSKIDVLRDTWCFLILPSSYLILFPKLLQINTAFSPAGCLPEMPIISLRSPSWLRPLGIKVSSYFRSQTEEGWFIVMGTIGT